MLTLAAPGRIEVEIRRSRFVAHAAPVTDVEATRSFLESVADPAATHNCWAWKIGSDYRSSDDGEPAGSAGRPILAAIEGRGLDQTMIVVTRYFGGIKLGIGGLVRAYTGSAARCIDAAGLIDVQPTREYLVEAGFNRTGELYAAIEAAGARKLEDLYHDGGISVRVEATAACVRRLRRLLSDATRGEGRVREAS